MVHIKSSIVNIKMMFLRSFAFPFLTEDAVGLHLVSSQPPTITLCNADLYNTWRLFTVSLSLSFSFSSSLPLEKRQDSRVPEIESPWRDIRDGRSSAQPLQKLHINESRRKKAPRTYRHIFPCSSDSSSLRSRFFFSSRISLRPILSGATSSFPLNFLCPRPSPPSSLPRSLPVDSCYFAGTIRPL